ncbi:MAG: hypothetical protein IPL73_21640 [Candidatus Obscuribacter sp.]|nr:hypothetical protein [Candidatus Obscuribacter sp.]
MGFELSVPHNTLMTVGQIGDDVAVHVSLAVRENDWTLFGFATQDESAHSLGSCSQSVVLVQDWRWH